MSTTVRLKTAAIALPVLLGAIFLGPLVFAVLVGIAVVETD